MALLQFAMHEIRELMRRASTAKSDPSAEKCYLAALFAELAYYHIPQWEIDERKRAKMVPCEEYQSLVRRGFAINLTEFTQQLDIPEAFVAESRGVIAAGLPINDVLFIGFRGTQFLFDWRVNLRARLAPLGSTTYWDPRFGLGGPFGRFHAGFAEEACRISARIHDALGASNLSHIKQVVLSGHSLGGAVAAISEHFLPLAPPSVFTIGSPRYADLSGYVRLPNGVPTQIRRRGDMVPTVPPKAFGYVDAPYEVDTHGGPQPLAWLNQGPAGGRLRWVRFLAGGFKSHSIEAYRRELGRTAQATGSDLPLVDAQRLTKAHMKSQSR